MGDPGLVGLVSFVFTLWGTQNKRNLPTRPGSPTPCKQSLMLWCREGSLYFILTVSSLRNLTLLPPQSAVSLLQPSNGRPGERVSLSVMYTYKVDLRCKFKELSRKPRATWVHAFQQGLKDFYYLGDKFGKMFIQRSLYWARIYIYIYIVYLQNPIRTSSKFQCKVQK